MFNEARQLRIAELTDEVKRRSSQLVLSEETLRRAPSAQKENLLVRMSDLQDELRNMERQLHALLVEEIREELKETAAAKGRGIRPKVNERY